MNKINPFMIVWNVLTKPIFLLFLLFNSPLQAESGQIYLNRFMTYQQWSQHLPTSPDSAFLTFIDGSAPLSTKLREKWLYQLAYNKNWRAYQTYYKPSADLNLQCYAESARYELGQKEEARQASKALWLQGPAQSRACNQLFERLLKNHDLDEQWITQRLLLALDQRDLSLAVNLLKQYSPPRLQEAKQLIQIHQNPRRISQLQPSLLHSAFYLYGLKRMVSINMTEAMNYWQQRQTKTILSHAQQQAFLAHLALYKAMRNHPDTPAWFAKIQPAFYNETLLGWQIRYALKYRQWSKVERLIDQAPDKESPCWQYWLARALEAQGQQEKAKSIYVTLANMRHYYGFLASLRLKKEPNFANEPVTQDRKKIAPYQPITNQIRALYLSKQTMQASRLLNDFMSELPKDEKSALLYWLDHDLQWHGKSVYLSNSEEMNNQLSLRFPLAYPQVVNTYSKTYQIPKELVYAIIRQESGFRSDALSRAGAQGLMQVMPTTAKLVSKHEKIAYSDRTQLFSSQKNINIGVAYLKQLAHHFDQHFVLMAAAYNAGPKQVNYWLKNHPPKEIDIWIETLPWPETRNYLKNVIAFYAVYQYRMQQKTDLSLFMKPF